MKKHLPKPSLLWLLLGFTTNIFSQYPYYFISGNFNPPNSWNQSNAVRMGSVANTNIQTGPATAVGNVYFSFYSANSGGTHYAPSGTTDSLIPLNTPFALCLDGGHGKSFYFVTQNLTDNYVFKTNGSGAPGNTNCAVIHVQGPVQSVTGLQRFPSVNVFAGQPVVIQATISDTFSPGQGAYLRFTTDNWASSTVIPMTGTGTTYSATIPGSFNVTGVNLNYYVFTSGSNLTIAPLDADLMTINLYNDDFANFTYIIQCPYSLPNTLFQLVETDKARYNPGDNVTLQAFFNDTIASGYLVVSYWHLGTSLGSTVYNFTNTTGYNWTWQPPVADFTGYMAQLRLFQNDIEADSTSIAIDVSSDWRRFPRYGFVSAYPYTETGDRQLLFSMLNRYHLNGLQFYDVNHKHNDPLAGTVQQPDTIWNDIANRSTYLSTVEAYINLAHVCNMKAMNYNLLYGAYQSTAVADGVLPQWGLFSDQNHQNQIVYGLPSSWASNLQVEDPANTSWQQYLWANEKNLFQAIPFDGWHVDQLGSQGTVYDYNGNTVNLAGSFGTYLQGANTNLNVPLVMNAVTNYGQQQITTAPVQFLYSEVWPPYTTYNSLAALIDSNLLYSNGSMATVLAAYMDQGISDTFGVFNTPAVLLTDAAIFANGGSHIEMGDHMLCNPYFPNSNLSMSCGLQQSMVQYYDFMTAYENLLRDSVSPSAITIQTTGNTPLSTTATTGSIWALSTQKTNTQIFQFINLANANTLSWNDPNDNQTTPNNLQNIPLSFMAAQHVKDIYVISPDWNNGIPQQLSFTQTGSNITVNLPYLLYWSIVVVDYGIVVNNIADIKPVQSVQVYPNPFHDAVNFIFQSDVSTQVNIRIMDELGRVVSETDNYTVGAGRQTFILPFISKPQGVYFWSVTGMDNNGNQTAKQYGKLVHF